MEHSIASEIAFITAHPIRLIGDLLHLASFVILFLKIQSRHSCAGISLKTQEIYAIIFLARYLDIFTNHRAVYLTVMKLIFMGSTAYIIHLMRNKYKKSYSKNEDTFPRPLLYLVAPSAFLSVFLTQYRSSEHVWYNFTELLWTFSMLLESVALLPQLWMLIKHGDTVELLTSHYIAALGGYRLFYLINWFWRWYWEEDYIQWLVWTSGLIQNVIFSDFGYHYLQSMWYKQKMRLPTKD